MGKELRMYFLTPYQLTGIQIGIQSGHSALEYAWAHGDSEQYKDFIENWKTWIILNSGTTSTNPLTPGTTNRHLETLKEIGIPYSCFYEPDLGDQLTAICFILSEEVFNKKLYPDFLDYLTNKFTRDNMKTIKEHLEATLDKPEDVYPIEYNKWVLLLGGLQNVALRDFIKPFRLA